MCLWHSNALCDSGTALGSSRGQTFSCYPPGFLTEGLPKESEPSLCPGTEQVGQKVGAGLSTEIRVTARTLGKAFPESLCWCRWGVIDGDHFRAAADFSEAQCCTWHFIT